MGCRFSPIGELGPCSTSSRVGVTEIVTLNPSELEVAVERDIWQSRSHE